MIDKEKIKEKMKGRRYLAGETPPRRRCKVTIKAGETVVFRATRKTEITIVGDLEVLARD